MERVRLSQERRESVKIEIIPEEIEGECPLGEELHEGVVEQDSIPLATEQEIASEERREKEREGEDVEEEQVPRIPHTQKNITHGVFWCSVSGFLESLVEPVRRVYANYSDSH